MTAAISPAIRRLCALVLLAGLIVLAYGSVVQPLLADSRDTSQSIDEMATLLARYRKIAGALPALEAQLAEIKRRQGSEAGLFAGANDTLVAAQLQGKLRSAVEAARGELKSTQILPPQEDGKLRRVTVRGQLASTLASLQRALYALESSSPYLFVDNLNLRTRPIERRREEADPDPVLDVRFDVSGYVSSSR